MNCHFRSIEVTPSGFSRLILTLQTSLTECRHDMQGPSYGHVLFYSVSKACRSNCRRDNAVRPYILHTDRVARSACFPLVECIT